MPRAAAARRRPRRPLPALAATLVALVLFTAAEGVTDRRVLRLSAQLEVLSAAGAAGAAAVGTTRSVLEAGAASPGSRLTRRLINSWSNPTTTARAQDTEPTVDGRPDPLVGFVNITVFHVNPSTFGVAPINMDTADLLGDMYFEMRSKALPIECASSSRHPDCRNAEVAAEDLVITKIVLTVDPTFGAYGSCTICVNGTDPYGNETCTNGVYTASVCGTSLAARRWDTRTFPAHG